MANRFVDDQDYSVDVPCNTCKHYKGDLKCPAFKGTIPDEILDGDNPHTEPLKGQKNDIVYEKVEAEVDE